MNKKQWLVGMLFVPLCAAAQVSSFHEVAQHALLSNPEVLARFHAWKAAKEERTAAAGGFLPRVDLSAGVSRENRQDLPVRGTHSQDSSTLTLTQMLYDGFATKNDVARLDYASKVRYFELRDISESTTLEVIRAYSDVMRFRALVTLAEDNYVRHRSVFDLIQHKTKAGVGRRVDLETTSGRLALAESNLLIETTNLHDVTARFLRLTGVIPSQALRPVPALANRMPADSNAALMEAIRQNPALRASIENVQSVESAARSRRASYQPRLDFQVRSGHGNGINGVTGSQSNHSAGLVLNWNLFSGGSDLARTRQFAEQVNAAKDLFDKTCRDVRQTLSIAYNDTRKLAEQITYLDQHQLTTEKARDAYRQQFDIGQRTLLDLLDTENELFQARRAYTNATFDLSTAHARTLASMGALVSSLDLVAKGADAEAALAKDGEQADFSGRCLAEAPASYIVNKAELDSRAGELAKESLSRAPITPAAPAPGAPAGKSTPGKP